MIIDRPDAESGVLALHRGRTTAFVEVCVCRRIVHMHNLIAIVAQVYGARAASLVVKSSDAALLAAKSLRTASGESTHTSIYEISVQVMTMNIFK